MATAVRWFFVLNFIFNSATTVSADYGNIRQGEPLGISHSIRALDGDFATAMIGCAVSVVQPAASVILRQALGVGAVATVLPSWSLSR